MNTHLSVEAGVPAGSGARRRVLAAALAVALLLTSVLSALEPARVGAQAASGLTAQEILANCPCAPSDLRRFHGGIYPSDLPMAPAPDPGWTAEEREANVAEQLQTYLADYPADLRQRAEETFAAAREVMDVRLAAGLAMLVGTSGEPAIDAILDGGYVAEVAFDEIPIVPLPVEAQQVTETGQMRIVVRPADAHEDVRLYAPLLASAALDSDGLMGRSEAAVTQLLQAMIAGELLVMQPDMLDSGTAMSRFTATMMLALLFNSRSVMEGRGPTLFPGADAAAANLFDEGPIVTYADVPTPANHTPLLAQITERMGLMIGDLRLYDRDVAAVLDIAGFINIPGGLEPDDLITIAEILTIDLGEIGPPGA